MLRFLCVLSVIAALPLSAFGQAEALPPEGQDQEKPARQLPEKVARVGDEIITGDEFMARLEYRLLLKRLEAGPDFKPDAQFQRAAMSEIIQDKLLEILSRDSDITASEKDVTEHFAQGRSVFPTDEDFRNYLQSTGLTEEDLRTAVRERLIREAFVKNITAGVTVTEEEVRERYDAAKEKGGVYRETKTADLGHLFVPTQGQDIADWTAARRQIEKARERILAGETFEAVAQALAEDPEVRAQGSFRREVQRDSLPDFLQEKVFTQPLGEPSDAIRGNAGWHLIEVRALHNPGVVQFEELREGLTQTLLAVKRSVALQKYLAMAAADIPIDLYTAEGEPVPMPRPGQTPAE